MPLKPTPWDSAEYLKTDADIRLYLEACIEEAGDDPALIVHALGVVAKAKDMNQLAEKSGLSPRNLPELLSADSNPSFAAVAKAAKALGLRLTIEQPTA